MPSLRFCAVELSFAGQPSLYSELDLHFNPGWTGIVGDNGAGKSTLLRLATGELAPTRGHIVRDPDNLFALLCPQDATPLDDAVRAVAASDERTARRWRGRLRCEAAQLERWDTLSLGERKRWQLAAALAAAPELLALDEPTNHLDGEGRRELVAALRGFRGIGLVVSHDRALLEELCTSTVRVHGGAARAYPGAYAAARQQWEAELEARREARAEATGRERRLARQLDAARRVEAAASRMMSTSARMRNRNDSDARSLGAGNLAEWAAAGAGRKVAKLRGAIAHAAAETAAIVVERERGGELFVDWEAPPRRVLAVLDGVDLYAGPPDPDPDSDSDPDPVSDPDPDPDPDPVSDPDSDPDPDPDPDPVSDPVPDPDPDPVSVLPLRPSPAVIPARSISGRRLLLRDVRRAVARDSRVRVAGRNGAGKTTLLRALLAASPLPAERVLWLPQELGEAPGDDDATLAELRAAPAAARGRVGQLAAALGLDPARALASPCPSPGEVRKLVIALGLARRAWLVVLDEPTNHLDLPSIERLERALAGYPGALLLVTHDDAFAAQVTDETWSLDPDDDAS